MPLAPQTMAVDDYEAIEAAVMETSRGRWFLNQYAQRNRQTDTEIVLGAIERVARHAGSPAEHEAALADLLRLVQDSRRAVAHVHGTTGSVPVDFVIETMSAIETRLSEIGGKTQAAAKLMAIASAAPLAAEAVPEPGAAEALQVEAETRAPSLADAEVAAIAGADENADPIPVGAVEPTEEAEDPATAATEETDLVTAAESTAEDEDFDLFGEAAEEPLVPAAAASALESLKLPQASPLPVIDPPAAVSGSDDIDVGFLTRDDDVEIPATADAVHVAEEGDDEAAILLDIREALTLEMSAPPPAPRRRPLPDSLRPDLPRITAADLDALTFEEKIVLFA